MKLTKEQQVKVEENLGLVYKVLGDKLKGKSAVGSRLPGELSVGDIIVFKHDGRLLVKRIHAVGGDTVIYREQTITVPKSKIYVRWDNLKNSFDSRYWNNPFVEKDMIHETLAETSRIAHDIQNNIF